MLEATKCAPQLAIKNNLNNAFKNFFRGIKVGKQVGYPKFHKKEINDSFSLSNDQFQIKDKSVKIPNLGWVRLVEKLRFDGKIISATISRTADKWYISIQVELSEPIAHTSKNQAIGVDLGIKSLATLSDGTTIVGSTALAALETNRKYIGFEIDEEYYRIAGERISDYNRRR